MENLNLNLSVFFEEPFWIAVYEINENGNYKVCKIIFGSEPKDYDVYNYILNNWYNLKFKLSLKTNKIKDIKINPKRMQRKINKQISKIGTSTKAQEAISMQKEIFKQEHKQIIKKEKQRINEIKFKLKQEKKKQKHKGH